MTWAQFLETRGVLIRNTARQMLRWWDAPLAIQEEDLEQEVLLGAWEAWEAWRPDRGSMSRSGYAYFVGCLAAKRWLHQQRNAPGRDGRRAGRYPQAVEVLPEVQVEAGQEAAAAFLEAVERALRTCRGLAAEQRDALVSSGLDVAAVQVRPALRRKVSRAMRQVKEAVV